MSLTEFTFIDEVGLLPVRSYTLECDDIDLNGVIAKMNARKWKYDANIGDVKKAVRPLYDCNLVGIKTFIPGGWSGGPIGMRKYTFPAIYEEPENQEIQPNNKIKCLQEGSHLLCSLEPR